MMSRNTLNLLVTSLTVLVLAACSDDNSDPPAPEPSFNYTIDGAAVKGIVIDGEVSVLDAQGEVVAATARTDENGKYEISFTSNTELALPLQIVIDGDGASSVCDVEPVCEVGTDGDGNTVSVGFGETYDLPAGFRMRAAVQTIDSPADDTFQASAFVSPLSEFVIAAALAMGDGQTLTGANVDVANEAISNLLLEIFPSLPVPAALEISSVPLLDLTDLGSADPEALDELSLVVSAVSASIASFVDAGSGSRGDIVDVIEDFSTQISTNAGTEAQLLANTDDALLARESVSSVIGAVREIEAGVTGGTISLPDDVAIDDLVVIYQDATEALPEIVDIWTTISPNQQPAPVESEAIGWADIVILPASGEAELVLETANVEATNAHIHQGFAGMNGPVVVGLEQDPDNASRWQLPEGTVLDADTMAAILSGGAYYNVHSDAYPAGEIRGQILPDNVEVIFATPTGLEQVPEPVDSSGFARGAVTIDRDTNIAQAHFTSADIEVGAAHIHQGVAGTNGGIVIEMMQDAQNTAHWLAEDVDLGSALVDALDSASLYFNLHTSANPGGELRGQVVSDNYRMRISLLDPDQVVSETAVTSTASGVVATTVDMTTGNFSAHLNTTDVVDPSAAHIHGGALGENGGVLYEFTRDSLNDRHWLIESATFSETELMAFIDGELYAQVHTAAYPAGEIRGQLFDARLDTDGDGVADGFDAFPEDASETVDSDSDGVGDNGDAFPNDPSETADSDNDGVGDNADAFPNDSTETTDSDGDGVGDNGDDCPNDASGSVDSNGDGVCDSNDTGGSQDTDGDGVADADDDFPNDPDETTDSDGDGVGDNGDAFPNDATETADSDGDGVGDNADAFPNDASETTDTDGDGVGDNADAFPQDASETTDSDSDGIGDNGDNCPNTANADQADSDGDGTGDACETTSVPDYSEVQAIFNSRCVGCHQGGAAPLGLSLEAGVSHGNLVNVASVQMPSLMRVAPNDSGNSYLVWKIEGRAGISGGQMPLGQSPLSDTQIQTIRAWIDGGANP